MTPAGSVLDVLGQALDLLADQESDCAISPEPCRVATYPGVQVPWDNCGGWGCDEKNGQLWANLISFTTSGTGPCQRINFTAIIGVVRCELGKMADDGTPPTTDLSEADAVQQAADADAIWNLFNCCEDRPDSLRDLSLVNWTALGPSGGCVGGQWTVTGALDVCC